VYARQLRFLDCFPGNIFTLHHAPEVKLIIDRDDSVKATSVA